MARRCLRVLFFDIESFAASLFFREMGVRYSSKWTRKQWIKLYWSTSSVHQWKRRRINEVPKGELS